MALSRTTRRLFLRMWCVLAVLVAASAPSVAARAATPAGGRIAFALDTRSTGVCCRLDIATMRPDGTGVRVLTDVGLDRVAQHPAYSPSGTKIAFDLRTGPGITQLWVMDADGGRQHPLVRDPFFADFFPSYSPDGADIVFSRCRPDFSACGVYRVRADGSRLRALTPLRTEILDFAPRYSPDGTAIVFNSFSRGGVEGALYLMAADGSGIRRVTPAWIGAGFDPGWSPDGRALVFSSRCCTPQHPAIWRIGADGTGLTRLSTPGAGSDFVPEYSPNGRKIAFERDDPDFSGFAVWLMNADGSDQHRIGRAFSTAPTWAPAS